MIFVSFEGQLAIKLISRQASRRQGLILSEEALIVALGEVHAGAEKCSDFF